MVCLGVAAGNENPYRVYLKKKVDPFERIDLAMQ